MEKYIAELKEMYDLGFSVREIEGLTTIPYNTVRGRLRRAGVKLRPPGAAMGNNNRHGTPQEVLVKTAFLYQEMGLSCTEIAEQMGCAQATARDRLIAHGVTLRTRSESMRMRFARRPMNRDNSYMRYPDRPVRPELTQLQLLALARCTEHGRLIVEWPWCVEPNAFSKRTLESLVRRGILKYVDPVVLQDDGTWLIEDNTSHPYYAFDHEALGLTGSGTMASPQNERTR